jgi:hypothetical protein
LVITPGAKHNLFDEIPAWTGQASVRYGWPLHVIENAGHLVVAERPQASLEALRAADGMGIEHWAVPDDLDLARQLGAIPRPPSQPVLADALAQLLSDLHP